MAKNKVSPKKAKKLAVKASPKGSAKVHAKSQAKAKTAAKPSLEAKRVTKSKVLKAKPVNKAKLLKEKSVTKSKSKAAPQTKSAKTKPLTKAKPIAKSVAKPATPLKNIAQTAPAKKIDVSKFLTPLDDRLIVQPLAAERMTAGGLYIPDTATGTTGNLKGLVVSAGRGHRDKKGRLRPMDVKAGDQVVFAEYSGSKISIGGQDFMFLRETDVLGILS